MKKSGGLRGLFVAIGVIDFIAGFFLFGLLLQGEDQSYFIYAYYGIFVVIGIGIVNAILSMVIPSIKGEKTAVPGFIFSLMGSGLCLFSLMVGQVSIERYKEKSAEKAKEEERKKEEEVVYPWLSTASFDLLSESDFEALVERYPQYTAKYADQYAVYNQEESMKTDGTAEFDGYYVAQKDLAQSRLTTNASNYTSNPHAIALDHTYEHDSESGTTEIKHSYFDYGNYGYLHLIEAINTKKTYTTTSQSFLFVGDEGYLTKVGFTETVVLTATPNEFYKCQLVYYVSYPGIN